MARTQLVSMTSSRARDRGKKLADRTRAQTNAALEQDAQAREDYASSGLPPDWLTTGAAGAGAGWIFGPVGGLAGALVSAVLSKRRRDGIAVQASADAETASSLIDGGAKALKRLESSAKSDEEQLEVALLRDKYDAAVTLAQNPDSRVALEGFRELLALPGILEKEADEIEQARIESQQRDEDRLQTEVGNLNTLSDDYRQESARFIDQRNSYAEIRSAFAQPNGAGDVRGVYTFLKMLDPGSTIMPGELALAENTGGAVEKFRGLYNKLLEGESLTPIQRMQFQNEARESFENAQRAQLEINTRYMERGRAMGIRDPLLSTLTVTADPLESSSYRTPDPLGRELVDNIPEGAQVVNTDGSLSSIVDYWSQFGRDAVTQLDGSTYAYDQSNEQWYQTDRQGQTFRIPAPPPGLDKTPRQAPALDPADTDADGTVGPLESLFDPGRSEQRQRDAMDRALTNPGLFQPGGLFGGELTPEQAARKRELEQRRKRPTNE